MSATTRSSLQDKAENSKIKMLDSDGQYTRHTASQLEPHRTESNHDTKSGFMPHPKPWAGAAAALKRPQYTESSWLSSMSEDTLFDFARFIASECNTLITEDDLEPQPQLSTADITLLSSPSTLMGDDSSLTSTSSASSAMGNSGPQSQLSATEVEALSSSPLTLETDTSPLHTQEGMPTSIDKEAWRISLAEALMELAKRGHAISTLKTTPPTFNDDEDSPNNINKHPYNMTLPELLVGLAESERSIGQLILWVPRVGLANRD